LRLGAGVEKGEGVVDAGVDVDEQAIGLMGHRIYRILSSHHAMRR
jgi:hypothetical protein